MIDSFSGITGPLDSLDGATYLQLHTSFPTMILTFLLVSVLKKLMITIPPLYNLYVIKHIADYPHMYCVSYNLEQKVLERSDLQPPDMIDGLGTSFLLTSFMYH